MDKTNLRLTHPFQAMYAGTSISAGMKGASKAMAAMNKVWWKTAMLAVVQYHPLKKICLWTIARLSSKWTSVFHCTFQQMEPVKQIKVMKEFQKQSTQLDMTVLTLTLCWLVYFTSKFKAGSLMSYNSCSVYLFAIRMDELEHCKSIVKHIQFYVWGFGPAFWPICLVTFASSWPLMWNSWLFTS